MATPAVQDPDEITDPLSGEPTAPPLGEWGKKLFGVGKKPAAPPAEEDPKLAEKLREQYVPPATTPPGAAGAISATGAAGAIAGPASAAAVAAGATSTAGGETAEAPPPSMLVPRWEQIQASPEFKEADSDTRLRMLDDWHADLTRESRALAIQNGEDPNVYDKGIDNLYAQNRKTLETPFSLLRNVTATSYKAAAVKSLEMIAAVAHPFGTAVNLDDIKNMTLPNAQHELDQLTAQQAEKKPKADAARAYLKNPTATPQDLINAQQNLESLQDQARLYHNVSQTDLDRAQQHLIDTQAAVKAYVPGGGSEALFDIQVDNNNQIRIDALKRYIESGGTDLPKKTGVQQAADLVKQFPEMANNALKIDQVFIKEHPKIANGLNVIGSMGPIIAGMTVPGGEGLGAAAAQTLMGYADAFQTEVENANENLNERERKGEYISAGERAAITENAGAQNAFGTGSLMAVSNIILGFSFGDKPLDAGIRLFAKDNLKRILLSAVTETTGQVALQAGSQVTSNLAAISSRAAPDTPWYEGVAGAAETGLIYGGAGSAVRFFSSLGQRKGEQIRLNGIANDVQNKVIKTMANPPFDNMTEAQAYEHVLNETVEPKDRDNVRKLIALQESAKDQRQTADKLRESGSPSTANELDKTAQETANTSVVDAQSEADRLAALKAQIQRDVEQREEQERRLKEDKDEDGDGGGGGVPSVKKAPEKEVPTPKAEDSAARDQRRQGILDKVNQLIGPDADQKAKSDLVTHYLSRPGGVYMDPNMDPMQRSSATQVVHDLGIGEQIPNRPKKWAKNTPQVVRMMEDHFSDYLDQRLQQKQQEQAAKEAAAAAPTEEGVPPAVAIPPPELMKDAIARDNPDKIVQQLQAGHEISIPEEAFTTDVDNFFAKHINQVEANPQPDGSYLLKLPKEEADEIEKGLAERDAAWVSRIGVGIDEMHQLGNLHYAYDSNHNYVPTKDQAALLDKIKALPEAQRTELEKWFDQQHQGWSLTQVERGLGETLKKKKPVEEHREVVPGEFDFELSKEKPKYVEETDAMPPHPQENELLKQAADWLKGDRGTAAIASMLRPDLHPYIDRVKSAALEGYRRAIRSAAGKEVTPEKAKTALEAEPAEHAPIKEAEEGEVEKAEETAEKKKVAPSIYQHVEWAAKDLVAKTGAQKMVKEGKIVRLDQPLGEGAAETKEAHIAAAPYQEQAEGIAPTPAEAGEEEMLKAAPELSRAEQEKELESQRAENQYSVTGAQIQEWANKLSNELPEKDRRVLWYILTSKNHIGIDTLEVPEKYRNFQGMPPEDVTRVRKILDDWFQRRVRSASARAEETVAGYEPGHIPPGVSGHHEASTSPPVHAQAHEASVLPKSEGKRSEHGEPPEELGGREPGVPPEGKTPPGQPPTVLPPPGGEGGGAGGVERPPVEPPGGGGGAGATAKAGGERTEPVEPARGPTAAAGERTAIVQPKSAEARGGPNAGAGGGIVGVQRDTGAADLSGLKPGEQGSLEYNRHIIRRTGTSPFKVITSDGITHTFPSLDEAKAFIDYKVRPEVVSTGGPAAEEGVKLIWDDQVRAKKDAVTYLKQAQQLEADAAAINTWPDETRQKYLENFSVASEPGKNPEVNAILKNLEERKDAVVKRMAKVLGRTPEEVEHYIRMKGGMELAPAPKAVKPKPAAKPAEPIDKPTEVRPTAEGGAPVPKPAGRLTGRALLEKVAKGAMRNSELAANFNLDLDEVFGGEPYDANKKADVTHLTDAIDTAFELKTPEQKETALRRMSDAFDRASGLVEAAGTTTPSPLTAAAPPAEEAVPRLSTIARTLLAHPDIAADHGIEPEEAGTPEEMMERINEEAELSGEPEEFFRNLAVDLGLMKKPAEAAAKPEEPAGIMAANQQKILDAYKQLSAERGRESVPNADVIQRAGINVNDGKNAIKALGNRVQLDEGDWASSSNAHRAAAILHRGAPRLYMRVEDQLASRGEAKVAAPDDQPAQIAARSAQNNAEKIAEHLLKNPEVAERSGLAFVRNADDLVSGMRDMLGPSGTSEKVDRLIQSLGQKLGVLEPPKPPGGTESSGVMHSLAIGMSGVHHFSGQVSELIDRFRQAPDPDMQAFAVSLNAHRDTIAGMPVRELNNVSPAIFYHDGELWVSRPATRHQLAEPALAHEIQHSIAQQKIANPRSAEDFTATAHWEHLRDQLRQSLPAEVRDRLDELSDVFDRLDSGEELDTRYMSRQDVNWLPVAYAAHDSSAMLHAAFSNPVFRDYLKTVQMGDGRTLLQGVEHWAKTVFGQQGLRYADRAVPLVKNRPGMPVKFNPKVFDLRKSYPMTESEKHANLMAQRYNLRNGVSEALKSVMQLSDDARHRLIGKALLEAVEAHPEIKIGLEDRLGGIAGGYDFHGDRVTVNPHMDNRSIESSILHETVHALTLGKIDAYEKGLIHLLKPEDMRSINELEDIRRRALEARGVPQIVRDIADLPTYEQREKAWLELGQRDPALMNKFYGLGDTREFASEVMSNGQLQDFLNRLPYEGEAGAKPRTMLQKMFSWVRKFLGFREDTAMSHAFDSVASLSGGRRVMESDIQAGGLISGRTMPMQENLLAKRYIENKAAAEGYAEGARQAPPEQINAWLREFRDQRGLASGEDPYKPTTIAAPETRGQFRATPELARITDPRDLIDHLAQVSGNSRFDGDAMREAADRAFKDRALTLQQYLSMQSGLNELDHHVFNKLFQGFGSEEDNHSMISRWLDGIMSFRPGGSMARTEAGREIYEQVLKGTVYNKQEAALKIRNREEALNKAVVQSYQGGKATPKQLEDMNNVLKGGAAPPTMPAPIKNALADMRAHIDSLSADIAPYLGTDKRAEFVANLGKYVARTYRFFDDPRYDFREASLKYRIAAETQANDMLKGSNRRKEALRIANNADEEAERKFGLGTTAGINAGRAAKKKAYTDAMKNIGPAWVSRKLTELNQIRENKATNFLQYGHAYNINEGLLQKLSKLPPAFRQLIGEETDPAAIFAKTAWRQEAYLNSVQLSKGLLDLGRRTGIFSDRISDTNTHQVPTLFAHMGELAGKWTTRDVARTLTQWSQNVAALDDGPIMKLIRGLEGNARYLSTIGNLPRTFGNWPMMFFQHLNNGYNPFLIFSKNVGDPGWSMISRMNTKAQEAYLADAYRHGLSDKEGDMNIVMDFLKNGPHITDARNPLDIMDQMANWMAKAKGYKPAGGKLWSANRWGELLTDLHTAPNFISKISQWEQEKIKQRAFNDEDVKLRGARRFSDEEIKDLAARVVRDTNISYSLAPPMIQAMRRQPIIGTFLTFWEEGLRSFMMSGFHVLKNIKSDNSLRKRDGYARAAGMLTSMAIPLLMQKVTKSMFGVSDPEDQNFRKMLPPWERNMAIIYGPKDGTKRMYMNGLYSSAQSDLWRGMHALLNFNNPQGIPGQVRDAGWELFRPALSLGLFPGAGVDLLRNQTEFGTQVYNPEDHPLNIMGDVGKYLFNREVGGSLGHLTSRIIPGLKPEGTVSPGGSVYNLWTALGPEIGFNVKEMSFPERLNSNMYSSQKSMSEAERIFTGPIQRSGRNLTDDEMSGLYQRSEDARRIVFRELHDMVEAARFGGMTTPQIRTALKIRRYSSEMIDDLLTGRYHPYIPSSGILKNARSNGNLVPPHLFSKHGIIMAPEEEEE